MCGRDYSISTSKKLIHKYLEQNEWPWEINKNTPEVKPNFNMCPTQTTLVLRVVDTELGFREMRWGLVPVWAKTVKDADKYSMINARHDEVAEKRSYKDAFRHRRCIVPVSGFYEWKREGEEKRPFAIHLKDEPIMSLAGIWEHWVSSEDGTIVDSYSIITQPANKFMAQIHSRMPLILDDKSERNWLDPSITNANELSDLMKPIPSELLAAFEVSSLVNSPKNNRPEVLEKVGELPSKKM